MEFADYREYTPGDPPNLIDWAIYARSDRYVIRRYQEETNLRAHFLLDISESMSFREAGLHSKMDYACYLAAALMLVLLGQSDSAGLTLFNEEIRRVLSAGRFARRPAAPAAGAGGNQAVRAQPDRTGAPSNGGKNPAAQPGDSDFRPVAGAGRASFAAFSICATTCTKS